MHLQITLHQSILGKDTIVLVACIAAMSNTANFVALLKGLGDGTAYLLDDAGVVAAKNAVVCCDAKGVVLPVCWIERDVAVIV